MNFEPAEEVKSITEADRYYTNSGTYKGMNWVITFDKLLGIANISIGGLLNANTVNGEHITGIIPNGYVARATTFFSDCTTYNGTGNTTYTFVCDADMDYIRMNFDHSAGWGPRCSCMVFLKKSS